MCLKLEAVKLELELEPFIFVSSVLFSICGEAMSPSGTRNMVALTPGGMRLAVILSSQNALPVMCKVGDAN